MRIERYSEIIEKISSFVNFPFSIIDDGMNAVYFKPMSGEFYLPKALLEFVLDRNRKANLEKSFPYIYVSDNGIFVGVIPLGESHYVFVGPALSQNVSIREVAAIYSDILTKSELSTLRTIVLRSQKTDSILFANVLSTIYELVYNKPLSGNSILKENFMIEEYIGLEKNNSKEMSLQSQNSVKNYVDFEDKLVSAIVSGEHKNLDKLWERPTSIVMNHVPMEFNLPVYEGIPILSVMRRAAIQSGANMNDAFRVYDLYASRLINKKTSVDNYVIMTEASYSFCELVEKRMKFGQYSSSAQKCVNYIYDHIGEKITISDLALVCGQSSRQVSRIFEHCFGTGVAQYIISERIKIAKEMIVSTQTPIVEIGNQLGFSSQSHFSKVFLQYVGCTPKTYRNRSAQL